MPCGSMRSELSQTSSVSSAAQCEDIITDKYSVQLCLGFEYPKFGGWTVALHRHIVELFRVSPQVWLSMELRLSLPEGLTTWLYAYIESQTRLIPTKIPRLQELCGSDSGQRAFSNSLRLAMKELARRNIVEPGWSIRRGEVRWMKKIRQSQPD